MNKMSRKMENKEWKPKVGKANEQNYGKGCK